MDEIIQMLPPEALEDLGEGPHYCSQCDEVISGEYAWIGDIMVCEACVRPLLDEPGEELDRHSEACERFAEENCSIIVPQTEFDPQAETLGQYLAKCRHEFTNYDALISLLSATIWDRIKYQAVRRRTDALIREYVLDNGLVPPNVNISRLDESI